MRDGVQLAAPTSFSRPARRPAAGRPHPPAVRQGRSPLHVRARQVLGAQGLRLRRAGRARQVRLRGGVGAVRQRGRRRLGHARLAGRRSRGATAPSAWPASRTTASRSGPWRPRGTRISAASLPATPLPTSYRLVYRRRRLRALAIGVWACVMNARATCATRRASTHGTCRWRPRRGGRSAQRRSTGTSSRTRAGTPSGSAVDFRRTLADVRIPVLHWGGWYDVLLQGTLAGWSGVRGAAATRRRATAAAHHRADRPRAHAGRVRRRASAAPRRRPAPGRFDHVQRFFDHWLRGEDNGRRWRRRRERLRDGRRALAHRPTRGRRPGADPTGLLPAQRRAANARRWRRPARAPPLRQTSRPTPSSTTPSGPSTYWLAREPLGPHLDSSRIAAPSSARPDVLVYTTDALAADLEVIGPAGGDAVRRVVGARHRLHGDARRRVPGRLRAARPGGHRAGPLPRPVSAASAFSTPARSRSTTIDLWATAHLFAPRPSPAARGLEQQLRPLRPQPQHRPSVRPATPSAQGPARRSTTSLDQPVTPHAAGHPGRPAIRRPGGSSSTPTDRRTSMRARTTWLSESEKRPRSSRRRSALLERVGMSIGGSRRSGRCWRGRAPWSMPRRASCAFRPSSCAAPSTRCPRRVRDGRRRAGVRRGPATTASHALLLVGLCRLRSSTTAPASAGPRRSPTCAAATALLDETPELDVMWTTVTRQRRAARGARAASTTTRCSPRSRKHVTFVD